MEKIKTYIVIIILLMVLKPGFAQETENISLDGYLEMAAKNNPELKDKIAENGYQLFKQKLTPKVLGKELKEIIREILKKY